jgi:hypothetical protein
MNTYAEMLEVMKLHWGNDGRFERKRVCELWGIYGNGHLGN